MEATIEFTAGWSMVKACNHVSELITQAENNTFSEGRVNRIRINDRTVWTPAGVPSGSPDAVYDHPLRHNDFTYEEDTPEPFEDGNEDTCMTDMLECMGAAFQKKFGDNVSTVDPHEQP